MDTSTKSFYNNDFILLTLDRPQELMLGKTLDCIFLKF